MANLAPEIAYLSTTPPAASSVDSRVACASPPHPAASARRGAFAVAIVAAPLLLLVGTLFSPSIGGVGQGAAAVASNMAADPLTNQLHLAAFIALSFVLPISALGLAELAYPGSPSLATIGGALGLVGWIPWGALTVQDDITFQMARMGGGDQLVSLWNRFTLDPTMMTFLLVYIVGHLVAFIVLAVALGRARVIPWWAAWALALTSPLTIIAFPSHQPWLLLIVIASLFAGSVPAAVSLWRARSAIQGRP